MKLAITAKEPTLESAVDPRFGRAAYILIVDSETLEMEALNNQKNVNSLKGAGIQASVMISEQGAEVLLTGYCGPNAMKTLNAANIKVINEMTGTIKSAVAFFNQGKHSFATNANAEGHRM